MAFWIWPNVPARMNSGKSGKKYSGDEAMLDIHISHHLVHDLFRPTKSRLTYPSQDSSIGGISAWYRGGPRFKSQQGR